MSFIKEVKAELFSSVPEQFCDPVTLCKPENERELSAVVAYWHSVAAIDWDKVPLRSINGLESDEFASSIIKKDDFLGVEFPLFCQNKEQIDRWGAMSADLLFVSTNKDRFVLVENKIGSNFTSGGSHPIKGQMARQADYLINYGKNSNFLGLIILTARRFLQKNWYIAELSTTLEHENRKSRVSGFAIQWEDVFAAFNK